MSAPGPSTDPGSGLIVGNLDLEGDLSASAGHCPPALSAVARHRISGLATLLRVFAREGDRLWTPQAVAPWRLPGLPSVPDPELISGDLARAGSYARILAWGETGAIRRLRDAGAPGQAPSERLAGDTGARPLHLALWDSACPDPAAVVAANHRGLALDLGLELAIALPGARMVRSLDELRGALLEGTVLRAGAGEWVLKAAHATAGRWRHRGRGADLGTPTAARGLERFFERHGEGALEPWLDRTEDFGAVALVGSSGTRLLGFHRQIVDRVGRFLGVVIDPVAERDRRLRDAWPRVIEAAGARLADLGYRGAFSVDAWTYRDTRGRERFHALGEINARMSFGLVARALAQRLVPCGPVEARVSLRLAKSRPPGSGATTVLRLLEPDETDSTSAWLEIEPT